MALYKYLTFPLLINSEHVSSKAICCFQIEVGDVICEIETDKATLEFESLEEG
jgi:hypothetical protein